MRDPVEWHSLVEKTVAIVDHSLAAHWVVGTANCRTIGFGQYVRTVQCVVQRAPSRVRSVERVTGVVHWHHQLRSGNGGDLVVYPDRGHTEVRTFFDQIADLAQKCAVGCRVVRFAAM